MNIRIVGDTASESGLGQIIYDWSGPTRGHFVSKDYGAGLLGLGVVLMCQRQALKLRRRIRLAKKDKILYLDVMFDLEQMRYADAETRKKIVAKRLADEIPDVLRKYTIPAFDQATFVDDWKSWLEKVGEESAIRELR